MIASVVSCVAIWTGMVFPEAEQNIFIKLPRAITLSMSVTILSWVDNDGLFF